MWHNGGTVRKLVLILIAFFAVITFIRVFAATAADPVLLSVEFHETD
jgi:hypothetical protein